MSSQQPPNSNIPGYTLHEQIGQGGMGVVHRARDLQFDRDVAIKLLVGDVTADSYAAARFRTEARISGQLQHPGIPAVHELGDLADGKPFLAMKLVRGKTLQALLELREDASQDHGQLLAIFEQVCHAVGYAHAHRVIHRDLKPSNIMVGKFGEVQVMDWGLAKVLEGSGSIIKVRPEDDVENTIDLHRSAVDTPQGGNSATRTGDILGTVAYMPPEQAGGEIKLLDARSDVFALGAILCQILIGRPPYVGDDFNAVRIKAIRGELREAFDLLDQSQGEAEWIALCKRCLAANKEERPIDGQAVAQEVSKLREDAETRARQAEMDRSAALIREAEEKRRRRQMLLGGGVLALVLVLGIAGTTIGLIRANAATAKEQKAKLQAEAMAEVALDANKELVFGIQNTLEAHPGTQELSKSLLRAAREGLAKIREQAQKKELTPDRTIVWANLRIGDVELRLGNSQAALEAYQAGFDLAERLVQMDPDNLNAQRDLSVSCNRVGDVLRIRGEPSKSLVLHQRALELNERLAALNPTGAGAKRDIGVAYHRIGDALVQLDRVPEAVDYFKKALAIDQEFAESRPSDRTAQRDLIVSYERLGDILLQLEQRAEAKNYYLKKLQLDERLVELDPKEMQSLHDLSISYDRLGAMAQQDRSMADALNYYQKSLDITKRLADGNLKDSMHQRNLSISYEQLGNLKLATKQLQEGYRFHTLALEIRERLYESDKANARAAIDLVVNYNNLGKVEKQRFQFELAGSWFNRSGEILDTLQKEGRLNEQDSHLPEFVEYHASFCEMAKRANDLDFVFAQAPEHIPELALVGVRRNIAEKNADKAIETAERFASWVESLTANRQQQRYDAACAFALCGQFEPNKDQAIDKVVSLLRESKNAGFFTPRVLAHFKNDSDFDGIRRDAKFVEFERSLEAK